MYLLRSIDSKNILNHKISFTFYPWIGPTRGLNIPLVLDIGHNHPFKIIFGQWTKHKGTTSTF